MGLKITPQQAALQLLERKRIRSSLAEWAQKAGFVPAKHHRLLIQELEAISMGESDRLMVFMPPGSAKSTYSSVIFPAWYLAQHPSNAVIAASNTQELADSFGRRVRNLVGEHGGTLGVKLSSDSQAAGRWSLASGGEYFAAGVGGTITGKRADLAVIDDPIRSREDADSELVRNRQWEWFKFDLMTRLKPGAGICLIQCMTGDTMVSMADRTLKPLRDIRPGDKVLTYSAGKLDASVVRNWKSSGIDSVLEIKTTSGVSVKANERHPFLVQENGKHQWIRAKNLRRGHAIVQVNGESGREKSALSVDASSQQNHADTACRITIKSVGQMVCGLLRSIHALSLRLKSNIATALQWPTTSEWLPSRVGSVLFASSLPASTCGRIGAESYALTTATQPGRFARSCATIATLLSVTRKPLKLQKQQPNTSDFTVDTIESIKPAGREEVFDVQVDGTENFIANGLVSHNTRWHEDDLAGRILDEEPNRWRVVKLPMEAEENDPLGRVEGELLWPEWFRQQMATDAKRDPRVWSALYQQRPAPESGNFFRREWFIGYTPDQLPTNLNIYCASDHAIGENQTNDRTALVPAGIDSSGVVWILPDVRWGRMPGEEQVSAMVEMMLRRKPITWFAEKGHITKALGPFLNEHMRSRGAYAHVEQVTPVHDKLSRAQAIKGRMSMGLVRWPKFAPWYADAESEFLSFPAGKHDDLVDAVSHLGMGIDRMQPPTPQKPPREFEEFFTQQENALAGAYAAGG